MFDIINNERYDLSDWLIHFFRDVDMESSNPVALPEFMGWSNLCEEDRLIPALFFLRCAIRQQRLWATWAYRNDRATIYGENPAVCFTEMPVAAFWEAATSRQARGENISPYGIMIPKNQMAKIGARPVIYGLSQGYHVTDESEGRRIIDPQYLPLAEQYRFVAYDPTGTSRLDWTHEREWRWPFTDKDFLQSYFSNKESVQIGSYEDMPALLFSNDELEGLGIIVQNVHEAQLVYNDLLALIDRNCIPESKFSFILSYDTIPSPDYLINRANLETHLSNSRIAPVTRLDTNMGDSLMCEFTECCSNLAGITQDDACPPELGKAWLWLYEPRHPLTRALLKAGRITINNDNKYLVDLAQYISHFPVGYQEKIIQDFASKIQDHFKIRCGYFSVRDHSDPNRVPFYCDPPLEDKFIFNTNF